MADELARQIIDNIKAHAEPGGEEAYCIEIEMNTVDAWSNLKNVGDMVEAVRELIATKKA